MSYDYDYADFCREQRTQRREQRAKFGMNCPECVRLLPKAHPTILLPGQRCKIHGYVDKRKWANKERTEIKEETK